VKTAFFSIIVLALFNDFSHKRLNVSELRALQQTLVPALEFSAAKWLIEVSHGLLQSHDLLGLWKNGVGDGGGGGLKLLVDPGDLLIELSWIGEQIL